MISRYRPFRIACWALIVAFGLSVVIAISDPHSVRRSILAKAEESKRTFVADSVLIAEKTEPTPVRDREVSTPNIAASVAAHPSLAAHPNVAEPIPTPAVPHPYDEGPENYRAVSDGSMVVGSRTVSSAISQHRNHIDSEHHLSTGTMLVVSPEQLRSGSTRSQEVEFLPPPPDMEMQDDTESLDWQGFTQNTSLPVQTEPMVDAEKGRRDLEAEILSLRQEVDRLTESQQIVEHLDRLQLQQEQLLSMHENLPVDRLLEVIDLMHQQLTNVRQTFPPPPRDSQQQALQESVAGTLTITESQPTGSGRLSLQITEAELDDILELLERMTGTSLGRIPSPLPVSPSSATPELAPELAPEVTSEDLRIPAPTAARLTEVQPLSFEQEVTSNRDLSMTRSSRCASCHQRRVTRR